MSWGASWVISWFGKLKDSSNLFEEGPFMFPLWFGAVSKTLGFQNPKQTAPQQRSILRCLVPGDVSRNSGGKIPFYPGPDSALRAFWGAEGTAKPWHWAVPLYKAFLILYFGALVSCSCQTQPIFTLWTSSLSPSLKNTTHLRASAAQIPHQLRRKGLRSFRQPLFLWEKVNSSFYLKNFLNSHLSFSRCTLYN